MCLEEPTHLTFTERGSLTEMGKIKYAAGEAETPEDNIPVEKNGAEGKS